MSDSQAGARARGGNRPTDLQLNAFVDSSESVQAQRHVFLYAILQCIVERSSFIRCVHKRFDLSRSMRRATETSSVPKTGYVRQHCTKMPTVRACLSRGYRNPSMYPGGMHVAPAPTAVRATLSRQRSSSCTHIKVQIYSTCAHCQVDLMPINDHPPPPFPARNLKHKFSLLHWIFHPPMASLLRPSSKNRGCYPVQPSP